ncbi:MAG: transposase [Anaerolineae bacterium]|nr:transposase [Anaerolineae bacterium]
MSSSQELYNRLDEKLRALVPVKNRKRVTNWIWIIVGILQSQSCHLSQMANYLPIATKAESRVTLIRRWLMNPQVKVWQFYKEVLAHVLSGWSEVEAYLILDGVMVFGDRWQIFRVSLRHGCRAIPIAWTIVEGSGLVKVAKLKRMLEKVQRFLKRYVKRVTLLADAGFRDCDWAQLCQELGWNYAIRIACNTYITLPDGTSDRLDNLVPVNRNRYFQNVLLTRETKLQTNVSVTWTTDENGKPDMVPIITDQMACRARLREYGFRMSIEQSFRDDKSAGFDLEHTRLQHVQRIDHLLLAMAIATLWCHELGEFVLKQGESARCLVDPAHERTLSLFQLGLRWLKRFLATGLHFLPDFQALLSNLKLKPVVIPFSLISNV